MWPPGAIVFAELCHLGFGPRVILLTLLLSHNSLKRPQGKHIAGGLTAANLAVMCFLNKIVFACAQALPSMEASTPGSQDQAEAAEEPSVEEEFDLSDIMSEDVSCWSLNPLKWTAEYPFSSLLCTCVPS